MASAAAFSMQETMDEVVKNTPGALSLLQDDSALETILDDAHSMGLKPELALLAPRLAGEIEALFEEAAREQSGLPLEKALQAMERAGKMEIELPLVPLQESFWKVFGQEDFPAGPELSALAARLGFSVHR